MKKYFRENAKSGGYKKIQNDFDIKEKEINEKINGEKENLQKKYAHLDIKDNSSIQKQVKSLLEFGNNIKDVFKSIIFEEKKKKNNSELMLDIINNHEYKNYLESLDKINNNYKEELYKILESEVKTMCYMTEKDKMIFENLEKFKKEEKKKMESFISKFHEKENKPPLLQENDHIEDQFFKNYNNEEEIEIITLYDPLIYYEYNAL